MRIAIAETLDPDGALARWASPDLTALGHEVLPLPTQELAPVLGTRGLSAWILAVTEAFAPDLLMVCPPYDHALSETWTACRARGTKVVGFAMDEPLFVAARARPSVRDRYAAAVTAFDRLYVSAPAAATELLRRGLPARWLRWALSPAALDLRTLEPWRLESSPSAAAHPDPMLEGAAVLIGRSYARRVSLLTALARKLGAPVHVFGEGWAQLPPTLTAGLVVHGPLTGPAMVATLAAAGAVITTGDWEANAIAMVKLRLLEAAMCGARQVAQASPDLDAYFDPHELPRYADLTELAARVRALLDDRPGARVTALAAQRRAHAEHSWRARFSEIAVDLGLTDRLPRPALTSPPAAWVAGICAGASAAERRGANRLAASLYHAAGDLMGLARVLMEHDPAASATYAEQALDERDRHPAATTGLYARVAPIGPALGHVGFLDPTPELEAIRLTALLSSGDLDAASSLLGALVARADPDRLVATAAVLVPDDVPAHRPLWHALFSAALHAAPADPALYDEHRERFATARAAMHP